MKNFDLIDAVVKKIELIQAEIIGIERYEQQAPRMFYSELAFSQRVHKELLFSSGSILSITLDKVAIERLHDCILDAIQNAKCKNRKDDVEDYTRLLREISQQVQFKNSI